MEQLSVMCTGEIDVDWRELQELQLLEDGRSLKSTDNGKIFRLAENLLRFGLTNNLQVWFDESNQVFCFDAHHRKKAFALLDQAGVKIPLLPATRCLAASKVEAMRLLLAKETKSSWINIEVLPDYLSQVDLNFDMASVIDIPDLDWSELSFSEESSGGEGSGKADEVPEVEEVPVVNSGDLIELGEHRLFCGDSTKKEDVELLLGEEKAVLLHADPPYGMGKEKDGVQNDNLYREKLDGFQMEWWKAFRLFLVDNASVYIWGNAEDLWRLWYKGGLKDSERLTFRNELVWGKGDAGAGGISHQGAKGLRQYPNETERCLFFMLGEQGFNNNADNYWEGWEPIRKYLEEERKKAGWDIPAMKRAVGHSDSSRDHWTSKSQWSFVTEDVYKKMQKAANGDALKKDYDAFKKDYDELKKDFYATRAYFDNTHENMTDVWQYGRVQGEERRGHATPKPVEMIERAIKSSSPVGALVVEPFLGSGTTLIACEKTGRKCYGMEIDPGYCQVTVQRWCDFTGKDEVKINGEKILWSEYVRSSI